MHRAAAAEDEWWRLIWWKDVCYTGVSNFTTRTNVDNEPDYFAGSVRFMFANRATFLACISQPALSLH